MEFLTNLKPTLCKKKKEILASDQIGQHHFLTSGLTPNRH